MSKSSASDDIVVAEESVEDKVIYNPIGNKAATFKSGTNKKIHSWFRLTPSFGPDLVDIMLKKLNHQEREIVLDPFGGASTTLIQCRLNGISSFGFEINPLLYFVGKTSLNWDLDPDMLATTLNDIENTFKKTLEDFKHKDVEDCGFVIPKIHNVYRWWRKDVLKELLILKHTINTSDIDEPVKNFLQLGFAGVLVPDLTNVTLGKLQLHFINRDNDAIHVFETFKRQIQIMISDIKVINSDPEFAGDVFARLYHTDTTDISHLNIEHKASLVITSPPYPNRYSYVWNTRPHLYFFDIFERPNQASHLDTRTIGGTWGVATSNLVKGIVEPLYPILQEVVEPVVSRIRQQDNLMANYVMKYFNLLSRQIIEMEKVVAGNVRVAYVVGNSEIRGTYVETDVLLGKIFEGLGLGYRVKEITRFRKRNSGFNLFESIVYAAK